MSDLWTPRKNGARRWLLACVSLHDARIRDLVTSRSHDFAQAQGTRLERRLKWLARRPLVTIGGFVWVAITSIYGHLEMFRKVLALLARK
jgi:hypothetical protein